MSAGARLLVAGIGLWLLSGIPAPAAAHPRVGAGEDPDGLPRAATVAAVEPATGITAGDVAVAHAASAAPASSDHGAAGKTGLALAGVAALLLVAPPRRPRALALALILVLGLLAFETGLHSVHHMGQDDLEARCAVASAAPHLAAADVEPVAAIDAPPPTAQSLTVAEPHSPLATAARFHDGRAPPAPLA